MTTVETPVVIVGGGLVGLTAAILLAGQKVPFVLLEKHLESSLHPRAIGYTPRTMEIFHAVGVADQIPQIPGHFKLRRVKVESLTGKWEDEEMPWKPSKDAEPAGQVHEAKPEYTPFFGAAIAQDRLEPILREKALSLNTDLRLGWRMTSFVQNADGINVTGIKENGESFDIMASYMIAADGHRSAVRESLGFTTTGRGHLNTVRSVLFRASLDQYMKDARQFVIRQPTLEGFLTTYGDNRWVLMFTDDVERSNEAQEQAIRAAVGLSDLEFEVITTGRWELKASIADTFQNGRVFLAGDAAHTLPPTRGGYGANTGIHDVHNLAWKLAAVVRGTVGAWLLDTYTQERQPVAWLRHQQTFARPDYAQYKQPSDDETEIYDDSAIELGQIYQSDCVFDNDDSPVEPLARLPDQWNGRPGTRAPHSWLTTYDNRRISSLDLFQQDWVLVTEDERWQGAVSRTKSLEALNLSCIYLNSGEHGPTDDGEFCRALGLSVGGASLIRPDGYIAWRMKEWTATSPDDLSSVVGRIVSRAA